MYKRKKSKYKHAVVGGKKYYLYRITWIDPCGDSGHAEADEVKKLLPAKMITQGYIFDKDKKKLLIGYGIVFAGLAAGSAIGSYRVSQK